MAHFPVVDRLRRVFKLLKKTQPLKEEADVSWQGPHFIDRPGRWYPSQFSIYQGTLYCRLLIPPGSCGMSWEIGSKDVEFEKGSSSEDYYNGEPLWAKALFQIEHRLRFALKDFGRYNRLIERRLPLSCRTGKLQRSLSWPKKARFPLPLRELAKLGAALDESSRRPWLKAMTRSRYLKTTAVAYDAAFTELRAFLPLKKYKRKADGRHGGLLDLPPSDRAAFAEWFHSGRWAGTHPWEIVFGHPHGIMIAPHHDKDADRWHYCLWVDSLGCYTDAARMAMALAKNKIPFEFSNQREVLEALRGIDEVDVGPDLYSVHFDELKKERADAVGLIRWDPIPRLGPITPDQAARIASSLRRPADSK